ncbi:DAK2 domain-containing protein [Hoeflea prorocentri]|uniref:DAK2 domain-containing protein n=1 Tax=Hoeflea prorocentri TaxID=1922333 RepID=A0A9X3ZGH8_9HYPH|nr:DAK2 domain-containing protein [Hoeflea prorocentri]MCY6379816.1 DAK2 domain-containing protein [Hoeflea prorocentri]MDA5397616.1 DAK2 domain-containing protein [Hoeflea prorocentri]
MNGDFLKRAQSRFESLEGSLNSLDAAIGDGDHGSTILKGLRAAAASPEDAAKAFRVAAGGASGALFGQIIAALDAFDKGDMELGPALARAAGRVTQLGQAKAGDKTMLDALMPASLAGNEPAAAAHAARAGAEATRDMPAKRGRAKYVEGAGVGHLDPGAVSVAELLEEFAKPSGA